MGAIEGLIKSNFLGKWVDARFPSLNTVDNPELLLNQKLKGSITVAHHEVISVAYHGHGYFLGTKGELKWTGEWVSFLDTMLQLSVLRLPGRGLRLPTRVRSLRIDPSIHLEKAKEGMCEVKVDPKMDMVVAGGVELRGKQCHCKNCFLKVPKVDC